MTGKYSEIAAALSRLHGNGEGAQAVRQAIADLAKALFHVEFAQLARELRQAADLDAKVLEDTSSTTLRVEGRWIEVRRFSGQTLLRFEFIGFDSSVVGPDNNKTAEISVMSIEELSSIVTDSVRGIGTLLRRDIAIRQQHQRAPR